MCITNPHLLDYIQISIVSFPKNKVGLIFTLLFWFSVVLDFSRFHSKVCHLKEILKKNTFLFKLIDSCCIKNFLNKRLTEKPVTLTAKKKDLVIVLSFLGKLSLDLRICLKNSISKNLPFCKIIVILKFSTCILHFLQFKNKMPYCFTACALMLFTIFVL